MQRIYVRPRAGVRVLHPGTMQPLPVAGCELEADPYWLRRQADGDVEIVEPVEPDVAPVDAEE